MKAKSCGSKLHRSDFSIKLTDLTDTVLSQPETIITTVFPLGKTEQITATTWSSMAKFDNLNPYYSKDDNWL